jgi:hypothetical protein
MKSRTTVRDNVVLVMLEQSLTAVRAGGLPTHRHRLGSNGRQAWRAWSSQFMCSSFCLIPQMRRGPVKDASHPRQLGAGASRTCGAVHERF